MIQLTIPGKPFGKQRHRTMRAGKFNREYTPKETINYEMLVRELFVVGHPGFVPVSGPLQRIVMACYSIPQSLNKKKRALMLAGQILPDKKPDDDNILKIVGDALNGIAYVDDKQFADSRIIKWYSDRPRLEIIIKEIDLNEHSLIVQTLLRKNFDNPTQTDLPPSPA